MKSPQITCLKQGWCQLSGLTLINITNINFQHLGVWLPFERRERSCCPIIYYMDWNIFIKYIYPFDEWFPKIGLCHVLKRKAHYLQSQNMNITKIIFSALHLYAINQNYMQCLGLGNRAKGASTPTVKTIYYTFSSPTLSWLAESLQWIFKISACDIKTCRLYNSHVKVTGTHVMYDRSAWFLRLIIMSSLCALCCLPSVKKQKYDS